MLRHEKVILVIEDEQYLNDLICAELADDGYRPIPAYSGQQGLKLAGEVSPDLILLDIGLPDVDGIHVSREVNNDELLKNIPIIFVTSKCDLQTKLASFISGAKRYITKPFDSKYLLEQVRFLVDHKPESRLFE